MSRATNFFAAGLMAVTLLLAPSATAQDAEPEAPEAPEAPSAAALAARLAASDDDATRRVLLDEIARLGDQAAPAVPAVAALAADDEAREDLRLEALAVIDSIGRPANAAVATLLALAARHDENSPIGAMARAALAKMAAPDATKLSLDDARKLIWQRIVAERPTMNPAIEERLQLADVTTEEMWIRLGAQIIINRANFLWHATFLIHRGRVLPLGSMDFGGADQFIVADLDCDGTAELVFEWSVGSGILRSFVSVLPFTTERFGAAINVGVHAINAPLTIRPAGDREVVVTARRTELGRITATRDAAGAFRVAFAANPDLPDDLRVFVPGGGDDEDDDDDDEDDVEEEGEDSDND